jgi:hypothetical protein
MLLFVPLMKLDSFDTRKTLCPDVTNFLFVAKINNRNYNRNPIFIFKIRVNRNRN